jgi:hypothetical protein
MILAPAAAALFLRHGASLIKLMTVIQTPGMCNGWQFYYNQNWDIVVTMSLLDFRLKKKCVLLRNFTWMIFLSHQAHMI